MKYYQSMCKDKVIQYHITEEMAKTARGFGLEVRPCSCSSCQSPKVIKYNCLKETR